MLYVDIVLFVVIIMCALKSKHAKYQASKEENVIIEGKYNGLFTIIAAVFVVFNSLNIWECAMLYKANSKSYLDSAAWKKYEANSEFYFYALVYAIIFDLLVIALAWIIKKSVKLVVTNKRVYGTTIFGKRVDIPLDSVSAIGSGILSTVVIASSSGKIMFNCLSNYREIHNELGELLAKRQNNKVIAVNSISDADELKKYKDLLDNGVITQEEFDAKKKQLLGL